jgi:hypothetical protein
VRCLLAILLIGCALALGGVARAESIWTDANIVTGLDLSGSIEAGDAEIQIDGIAQALRAPEIVAAIQRGHYGRIGFAVFVWADGNYPVLVSWRLIGSAQEALATSDEVANRLRAIRNSNIAATLGSLTDLSGAMDYGGAMLLAAPFATNHRVLNIVGNGVDNVGEGPQRARDQLLAMGVTINGVALGHDRAIYEYFQQQVIGGRTAFVLRATDPDALVEVLARKFVTEIVFNLDQTDMSHKFR